MPAALPIIAPIAGAAIGGIMQGNENASNQQAANAAQQNAQNATAQAQAQALAQQQAGFQQALQRYQQYQKANASPVYAQAPIQAPGQVGPSQIGGGQISQPQPGQQQPGGMGQPPLPEQKIAPQALSAFIQLLQHAHGQAQKQGEIAAQTAPAGI